MANNKLESRHHARAPPSEYPDPGQSVRTPYPVLEEAANAPTPALRYGPEQTPVLATSFSENGDGTLLNPLQDALASPTAAANTTGLANEPPHLAHLNHAAGPNSQAPHVLTETQRLAEQFHVRRGDPGSSASNEYPKTTGRGSDLAGIFHDDTGGKAVARRAWEARHTYGDQLTWDPELDDETEGLEGLFAESDVVYANQARGGPQKRLRKGRGGWRKLLKGTEHENLGRSSGSGRGRGTPRGKRGPRRGRGKIVDPGREFKTFLAEANRAYLAGDLVTAADNAKQAVQANPEVYQAHALLSTIFEMNGRYEEAVQSLKHGAVTARNPEVWMQVAHKILERGGGRRDRNTLREASECYAEGLKLTTALKYDPDMELALRDRALELYEELNDVRNCRIQCRHIIKNNPDKTEYVQRYAMLCFQWQDIAEMTRAKECYEKAFKLHEDGDSLGSDSEPELLWGHLNVYLELVDQVGTPVDGIAACKRLARGFLGRKEETFWDHITEDDREFDNDNSRRNYIGEFQQGRASRDASLYGDGLPIDIRLWLGIFRIKMGVSFHDEAMRHFEPLLDHSDDVAEFCDAFITVGDILQNSGRTADAAKYYDIARTRPNAEDPDTGLGEAAWMQIARCYQILGRFRDAVTSYENVLQRKGHAYTRASARLAKLYEENGETEKARYLCTELITLNRRDLLHEVQIKMIPMLPKPRRPLPLPTGESTRAPLPPSTTARSVLLKPLPPLRSLPELSARPVALSADTQARIESLGPLSRPIIMPPQPASYLEAGIAKKPRGKKRGLLSTIDDDIEGIQPDESPMKRPRLKRKYAKQSTLYNEQERIRHLQDAQTRTHENYALVQTYWDELHSGTDSDAIEQWTEAAHAMLDEFRSMKVFFPDRDQNIKLKATENGAKPFLRDFSGKDLDAGSPKHFLKINFRDWQHVFVDLALLYVRTGEQDRCYRVVQEVLCSANVFYLDPELNQISYGIAVHVGLAFNDSQYLIQLARQVISNKPIDFRNCQGFQLFAAVARFSFGSNWFIAGPTQKFMLRMVKQSDYMSMTEDIRNRVDWSAQGPGLAQRAQNYMKEDQPDAHMLTMYGHMVAAANHSFSALPYYYRALALQPENICINLSIATMWIQFSMKRQVDNRQEGITNGLSFLYRYYDLRVKSGKAGHIQEAEYNVARMWHYLGLTHLAVPAYEKVLKLSKLVQAERFGSIEYDAEDYAQEAAYALQNLYGLVGNDEAARAVTEEWLVI